MRVFGGLSELSELSLEMAARACPGAARALEMAARACPGATRALEMAAQACPGAAGALEMAARASFGVHSALEKAARAGFRVAKAFEMAAQACSRASESPERLKRLLKHPEQPARSKWLLEVAFEIAVRRIYARCHETLLHYALLCIARAWLCTGSH